MKVKPGTTISNNVFTSNNNVYFDGETIKAVQTVATALLNLTRVFDTQGIKLTMLSIAPDELPDQKTEV